MVDSQTATTSVKPEEKPKQKDYRLNGLLPESHTYDPVLADIYIMCNHKGYSALGNFLKGLYEHAKR